MTCSTPRVGGWGGFGGMEWTYAAQTGRTSGSTCCIGKSLLVVLDAFLWYHTIHAVVAKIAKSKPSTMMCSTKSLKLWNIMVEWVLQYWSWDHTNDKEGHDHNACKVSSGMLWQWSQQSFGFTLRRLRLILIGMVFLIAHHRKFLIFGYATNPHTFFHISSLPGWYEWVI